MNNKELADYWREYAKTATPEGLRKVCEKTAQAYELADKTGIPHCTCCLKPNGCKKSNSWIR